MKLNELLINLLSVFGLPVKQDEYTGDADKYIIFVYEDEVPSESADNKVTADTVYLQIQLITPKKFDYFNLKKKIRNSLEGADFIVTSIRSFLGDVYMGTEKTRQTVFSVKYTEQRLGE